LIVKWNDVCLGNFKILHTGRHMLFKITVVCLRCMGLQILQVGTFTTHVHFVMIYVHLLVNVIESKNNAHIRY